jgi:hypothetical protein
MMLFLVSPYKERSEFLRTPPVESEGVRAELVRMQKHDGLTIGWYNGSAGSRIVKFDRRTVPGGGRPAGQLTDEGVFTRDGSLIALVLERPVALGVMKGDNSDVRRFPSVSRAIPTCWSYDNARIALLALLPDSPSKVKGAVFDFASQSLQDFDETATKITSQCWSPDGKAIVYESAGKVRIRDFDAPRPREIVAGAAPTWSPDGNWIAYLDENEHTYYKIRPSGEDRQKLFRNKHGMPGLYWSPDSRIVAYTFEGAFFLADTEYYRLRVRRLEDNSDDWVAGGDIGCCEQMQWVTSPQLLRRIESESNTK